MTSIEGPADETRHQQVFPKAPVQNLEQQHVAVSRTVSSPQQFIETKMTMTTGTSRRKLESEDSSYDSDHDNGHCNNGGGHQYLSESVRSHEDVSRTPSETLATEFAEYVSLVTPLVNENGELCSDSGLNIATMMRDPSYTTKVEFALRLGYTEELLQRALLKLGLSAAQNQILEELIRLQKTNKSVNGSNNVADNDNNKSLNNEETGSKEEKESDLLPIVIDGSNVAMSHGNKTRFSCKGILICVQYFQSRGHKDVTVFVPAWRKEAPRPDTPITDQPILLELEREGLLTFTPSRQVRGKRFVCHDDRYILNLASETEAVVVSNDNYKDLINDKPEYKKIIEERILMYSFVNDRFMPPDDPLGRSGPTLSGFLRRRRRHQPDTTPCPYGRKCTYGNKCKFFHAERANGNAIKSVTDQIKEQSTQRISEVRARAHSRDSSPGDLLTRTRSMQPLQHTCNESEAGLKLFTPIEKMALCRTRSTAINSHQQSMSKPFIMQQQQQQWLDVPHPDQMWYNVVPLVPDTSQLPPPPPRSPWMTTATTTSTSSSSPTSSSSLSSSSTELKSHRKISRQLTLNPSYDPRLHTTSIPFPPPVSLPPPMSHAVVTRNASAPEKYDKLPSTTKTTTATTPCAVTSLLGSELQQLHKTLSEGSVLMENASVAVSPLIGTASGVWETQQQPCSDQRTSRSKLYYHLAAVFPEDQVLQAMRAMPEETDPQRICALIIQLNEQRAGTHPAVV